MIYDLLMFYPYKKIVSISIIFKNNNRVHSFEHTELLHFIVLLNVITFFYKYLACKRLRTLHERSGGDSK